MPRKIIVDVDPGIDGAIALTMALFDPRLEVVAVTAVGGRVRPEQATQNVQTIIEQLDPPRWPRIGAAPGDQLLPTDALDLHGQDGLGNAGLTGAGLVKVLPADKILIEEVRAAPEAVTILVLGPMTNIAQALHRDTTWGGSVGRFIISGGAITAPGDVTPAAEFNVFSDPLAARMVIRSKTTKTLIPLDLSRQVQFSFDLLDHLPSEKTRAGKFLRRILPFAFRAQRQILGYEEIQLNALLPVVMATNPELFETHAHAVDVETEGTIANGMTIADRRNVRDWRVDLDVATNADITSIRDCVIRSLQHAGNES